MKKNVASQSIGAEMITAADGTAFTGAVTVLITIDNGTQSASGGTAPAHEGNGYHSYTPTQAETNGDHVAFTFTGTGAIPATVQVFTAFPQTVDNATNIASILTDTGTTIPAQITALNDFNPATDTVANVTTVATTTTNTDMRGTDSALLAASINLTAGAVDNVTTVATTTTNTDMRGTDSALLAASINLTAGAVDNVTTVATTTTNTDMRGTDSALLAASINLTAGAVDNVTLVGTTTTNTDMRGTDSALLASGYTAPDNAGITSNGSAIASLNDISAAQVNTEVVDVLFTDVTTEPTSVPASTASLATKISWVYTLGRNKLTQTATTQTLRNDADSLTIATSTVSDDTTTFTRGEFT
jgi:hypothetical protein